MALGCRCAPPKLNSDLALSRLASLKGSNLCFLGAVYQSECGRQGGAEQLRWASVVIVLRGDANSHQQTNYFCLLGGCCLYTNSELHAEDFCLP